MIIKTLFLASFLIASALASKVEGDKPFPAALLVQSNFDFSLTRKDFRVHYGGLRSGSSTPTEVSIKIYGPNDETPFTYNLKSEEIQQRQAFHFALDDTKDGKYEVEVCEGTVCSARTPSLTDAFTQSNKHVLWCETHDSKNITIEFLEPKEQDWASDSNYEQFEEKVKRARQTADPTATYETEHTKYKIKKNPSYQKKTKTFHAAIMHDLKTYRKFFEPTTGNEYCGRKYMLSLHSHVVDKATKKVLHRFKTVNYLSKGGETLFILGEGGPILLESTHKGVDIEDGTYEVLVSLCVTDKDSIESTYCANPIKKDVTVEDE